MSIQKMLVKNSYDFIWLSYWLLNYSFSCFISYISFFQKNQVCNRFVSMFIATFFWLTGNELGRDIVLCP